MKRTLYVCGSLALISSFGLAGGQSYAARQAAPMMNVRLCVSAPVGIPSNAGLANGIYNGAKLASRQLKAQFAAAHLNLLQPITLDYAKSDGSGPNPDQERQNALNCIANKTVMGYDGTLNSSMALVSEPILNAAGMVMISPSNSNVTLTSPKNRASQEPATYKHQIPYVTYYRTVTTDALQGPAGAIFLKNTLHAKSYYLVDDKQAYGAGLAASMDAYAKGKLGLHRVGIGHIDFTDSSSIAQTSNTVADGIVAKNPDAVYYGGNLETGYTLARRLRQKGYTKPIMGGDAIVDPSWISHSGAGAKNNYGSNIGPDIASASAKFQRAYKAAFHTGLRSYDATSYDAAKIILLGVLHAKQNGILKGSLKKMRLAVDNYVRHTNYFGATGHTTFDKNGDTQNRIISYYKVSGANWKYTGAASGLSAISPTG